MTQRMAQFSKVDFDVFFDDWVKAFEGIDEGVDPKELEEHIRGIYDAIELPKRQTAQSAGYDFHSPVSFVLEPNKSITIPTGIRCEMYDGWVLKLYVRSGLGFKYGISMANGTGIIDGDFCNSDNQGNIHVKLTNDSCLAKKIRINKGDRFCQGVFVPYGITLDDDVTEERNGGMGSTGA